MKTKVPVQETKSSTLSWYWTVCNKDTSLSMRKCCPLPFMVPWRVLGLSLMMMMTFFVWTVN